MSSFAGTPVLLTKRLYVTTLKGFCKDFREESLRVAVLDKMDCFWLKYRSLLVASLKHSIYNCIETSKLALSISLSKTCILRLKVKILIYKFLLHRSVIATRANVRPLVLLFSKSWSI